MTGSAELDRADDLGVTGDYFLGDKLRVLQPAKGYRAGIDAVLLAATARAGSPVGPILDVGAGAGTVGLCVATRLGDARVVLVEREPVLAALARQNIAANSMTDRVSVIEADITQTLTPDHARDLPANYFAHVLANPPFHDEGRGTRADHDLKACAHAMPETGLDAWVRFMARMASPGGRATMIHKAEALPRILDAFDGRFGAVKVCPIYARHGEPAIRVLVEGVKGSRAPMTVQPGIVLHGTAHAFTDAIDAILRHGAALAM